MLPQRSELSMRFVPMKDSMATVLSARICAERAYPGLRRTLGRSASTVFLEVLQQGLGVLGLEQIGPDRDQQLGRVVRHALQWRRTHKEAYLEPHPDLGNPQRRQYIDKA